MNEAKKYWDAGHVKYATAGWIDKPTIFATQILEYLPTTGYLLDLAAGQGQDSRFFAEKFHVLSTDLSTVGLRYGQEKIPEHLKNRIYFAPLDLSKPIPFKNSSFDVVYSHLGLHYFDSATTRRIFQDIARILNYPGIISILLNSTEDEEYGQGTKLESDYFEFEENGNKISKRYFSTNTLLPFVDPYFETFLLDNKGATYKDSKPNLIRYVGKKK